MLFIIERALFFPNFFFFLLSNPQVHIYTYAYTTGSTVSMYEASCKFYLYIAKYVAAI